MITASGPGLRADLIELWRYRELALFLAWRNIAVRYKQTAIGVAWAVLQPVAFVVVFTIAFGVVARVPTEGIPYPVFAYSGLILWQFFAYTLTEGSMSVVASQQLVTKVYFPRFIIPIASVLTGLMDFAINTTLLTLLLVLMRHPPGPIWSAPLFAAIAVMTALGTASWLAALNVRYRDVRYVLPFLSQIWLFASPVAYPLSAVPEPWSALFAINPMVAAIEGFRGAFLATTMPPPAAVAFALATSAGLLVTGVLYFRSVERTFADVI